MDGNVSRTGNMANIISPAMIQMETKAMVHLAHLQTICVLLKREALGLRYGMLTKNCTTLIQRLVVMSASPNGKLAVNNNAKQFHSLTPLMVPLNARSNNVYLLIQHTHTFQKPIVHLLVLVYM
jgi:hypothetical protein